MDRFSIDDPDKNQIIFKNALEFIGAVRAGISWERFCRYAVRFSDAFMSMLNATDEAKKFLSLREISTEYVQENVRAILERLHLNRDNDHYLTLALPRSASEAQIHKRWKELMLIYHPDRNNDEDAVSCAKRINEAYGILKNPRKKIEYDRKTAKTVEPFFTAQGRKVIHTKPSRSRLFIPPELRRMVPTLIVASSMAISCVILFVIFFKNRTDVDTYHAPVVSQENGQYAGRDISAPVPDKKEESKGAVFQPAEIPVQDINKLVSVPPETFKKERDTAAANLKTPDLYGSRSKSASTATPGILPSKAAQEKSMADTQAGALQATPAGHIEMSAVNPNRQTESPDQNTKKESSLLSSQNKPSPEQKETSGEATSALIPLPGTKENPPDVETEVFLFLSKYIIAYEEGDIARFMDLFSQYAVENNNLKYSDIRRFYMKNFEGNRYNYVLKNVLLEKRADPIIVSGNYSIRKVSDDDKTTKTNGVIRWTLNREEGTLKIVRIDYDRR